MLLVPVVLFNAARYQVLGIRLGFVASCTFKSQRFDVEVNVRGGDEEIRRM